MAGPRLFQLFLHCRLRLGRSTGLLLTCVHLEECSHSFHGVEMRQGCRLLHGGDCKFGPLLLGRVGHVLGVAVMREGPLACGQTEHLLAVGHGVLFQDSCQIPDQSVFEATDVSVSTVSETTVGMEL